MTGWKEKTLAHWEMIDAMARRRFGDHAVAEQASLYVLEALQKDGWRRVRRFSRKASFAAFLRSVVYRLLEDFSRQTYGRRQPPGWIQKLGGVWLRLYRLLCLERLTIAEAVERSLQIAGTPTREKIEDAAFHIKEQVKDCGSHQYLEVDLDEAVRTMEDQELSPERRLDGDQKNILLKVIFMSLTGAGETTDNHYNRIFDLPFDLTAEEKLLLRMRYVDGIRVASIAHMTGSSRHAINGRLRRVMKRVRAVLEEDGVAREVVAHLRGV